MKVLQNWQNILFLCLKYVSVLQLIFYFKGKFFFSTLLYLLFSIKVVELKPLSHKRDRLEKLAKARRKGYQKRSKQSSIAIANCWPECREMPLKLPRKRVRFRKESTVVNRLRVFRLNSHAFLLSAQASVGKSYISCSHIVSS